MANASKRPKRATISTATPGGSQLESGSANGTASAKVQLLQIPFQTGASLERIPDDVLHEVLSHLPTLDEHHVLFGYHLESHVIPSSVLVRTPTLRALSRTSRLLRSRCLGMAWQRLELCGASLPEHKITFYKAIGEATKAAITVLQGCPHLLSLIQTVSVVFTRYQSAEIIPEFAACLATLPNLTTIQVIHAHSQVTTAIKNAFKGIRLPSVRQISLPSSAHEIIGSCPNLEEVICTVGDGSTIIGSIVKGKCQQLRVLKGICVPLKRLVKAAPNLRHISFIRGVHLDVLSSIEFPLLDTIEFVTKFTRVEARRSGGKRLDGTAAAYVERASEILKKSKSQANKTVVLTSWYNLLPSGRYCDPVTSFTTREAIQL